ncbi:MAG: hypothetical protein L0L52_01570 [Staphylococcus equorum]|nr:hypothetical protein [Staphylococcus equorum]
MYKQIFKKENGQPELIENVTDEDTGESYFDYDESIYTDIMPENGLYQPIYFRDGKWYSATKEEYEESLPESDADIPDSNDFLNAQLLANDLEHNSKIEGLQQDIANLTAELLKIQGGTSDVHNS